jgi:hypothetical protein
MNVIKKPPNWNTFVFAEKLKWYAKKDNDKKNIYADKFKIKLILAEMNLEGLEWAKLITHIKPFIPQSNLSILVPVEHELKDKKWHFNQKKVDKLFKGTDTPEEFWDMVRKTYDIVRLDEKNPPPEFYVIKLNLGWNTMVFISKGKILKMVCGTHDFPHEEKYLVFWKEYVLKHYKKKIPAKLFAEEFIGYNMNVYEVYCIYGKPRLLSVYYESDIAYENNYLVQLFEEDDDDDDDDDDAETCNTELSMSLLQGAHLIKNAKALNFLPNHDICKQICKYAIEFAKKFEFIRVDFYTHKNKVYFSECTFKPGALKKIKWDQTGKFLSKFWTSKPEV